MWFSWIIFMPTRVIITNFLQLDIPIPILKEQKLCWRLPWDMLHIKRWRFFWRFALRKNAGESEDWLELFWRCSIKKYWRLTRTLEICFERILDIGWRFAIFDTTTTSPSYFLARPHPLNCFEMVLPIKDHIFATRQ